MAAWRLDGRGPRIAYSPDQRFPLASTFNPHRSRRFGEQAVEYGLLESEWCRSRSFAPFFLLLRKPNVDQVVGQPRPQHN